MQDGQADSDYQFTVLCCNNSPVFHSVSLTPLIFPDTVNIPTYRPDSGLFVEIVVLMLLN